MPVQPRDREFSTRTGSDRRRKLIRILPEILLGALASIGLAPLGIWPVALGALALLIWRMARADRPGLAFLQGLGGGFGWFACSMFWIVEPFLVEPDLYGWMAPFALILMALGGALFWALPVWIAARLCPGAITRTIAIVAVLTLSDWLRGWIFSGLPWALIGHIWIGTPIAQIAAWTGAIGLTALTLVATALPSALWRQADNRVLTNLPAMLPSLALIAIFWGAGMARQAQPLPPDTDLQLRIVQPNAEQHLKWNPEWSHLFFQRLLDLSAEPGSRDVVIWPETAVNFLLNDADDIMPAMSHAAGAPLIFGIQRREESRYYNSLVAVAPDGDVTAVYDKFHLVPFGEYIPWGDELARLGIGAFAAQQGNGYTAGSGPTVMSVSGLPAFQPLICYEAIFPQHLRGLETRPEWLLQITNDAWFGKLSGPYQHLAQARLRAIETGLPLVRSANTGVSAVIDAHGDIRAELSLGQVGKLDAALPGALPPTLWLKWGSAPIVILALCALIAAICFGRRPMRRCRAIKASHDA
ncbi:apolipoprotein N-acyltransferase [Paracoccus onubensis]|uniref:Apolipoprotein N-acyltransferase n=1 Tax=Paracoccus onubensis TaxID=1675788 RepID=A0A418SRS6_9RHOB|nr:apolipoprotein N-acyltransferase [Paracoccus onubensis]RJE83673.1 apolipoprotein N-acyltransferase [Paracoccus onubensis]